MDMCNAKYEEMMKDKTDENNGKKKKSHRYHPFNDKMQKVSEKVLIHCSSNLENGFYQAAFFELFIMVFFTKLH